MYPGGLPNECWVWPKSRTKGGYGHMWNQELFRMEDVHVVSHKAFIGSVIEGNYVLHRCDNPACWNPNHLFQGTQLDNMADASFKGRIKTPIFIGAAHPRVKLSDENVLTIRVLYSTGRTVAQLSRQYNVGWAQIDRIVRREQRTNI